MPVNTGPVDFRSLLESLVSGGNIPRNQTRVGEFVPGGRAQGPSFPAQGGSPGFLPSAFLTGNQLANQSLGRSIAPGSPEAFLEDDNFDDPGSQTPADDPNAMTGNVDIGGKSLANAALGLAVPGLGALNAFGGKFGYSLGDLAFPDPTKNHRDFNDMELGNAIAEMGANLGPGYSRGNIGGWGFDIDTTNLDTVGGPNYDFSEYGYGMQGIQNALNGVTAAEAAAAAAGGNEPDTSPEANATEGDLGDPDAHGGDTGGDGGDDKIICAALYRMGHMPEHIWRADEEYGRIVDTDVLAGYHLWAKPAVRWMECSSFAVWLAKAIVMPWAYHMAYLMGAEEKDNRVGRVIMAVGTVICRMVNRVKLRCLPA